MKINTATFCSGVLDNKRDEARKSALFTENIRQAHEEYPDEKLILTDSPLPSKFGTSVRLMQVHYYGKQGIRLGSTSKEDYKTLISNEIEKFFYAEKKGVVKISDKSELAAKTSVALTILSQQALKAAEVAAKTAFYSTLFIGVNNLFGLNSGVFGEIFPVIPDILISTMPFFSVQRLERGMSDRLLKYRAIGDVFLAHQKGTTDTLRVDMTLIGPYRGWYLTFLLTLQGTGEGKLKALTALGKGPDVVDKPPHEIINLPKKGKVQYESHITFPIITKTSFMLDMFLQTIEWHQEKDRGGHDVIYVHLLFRKFIDPKGYTFFDKGNKGLLDYGKTQAERLRNEALLDTIWKAREIGLEYFNIGMFGAPNLYQLDRDTVATDPYVTEIQKLMNGYTYDLHELGAII